MNPRTAVERVARDARLVALAYAVASVLCTWPLVADLRRSVPGDMGDPLLNAWILGWNFHTLGAALTGDLPSVASWWNANIFHPEPLTLPYSELLVAPSLLAAPVYAVTRDVLLAYNLLFLSSYALSALGAYLLVRELTGSSSAALVAGTIYGFMPYRLEQVAHLQVLQSQWMPFVLFGLTRWLHRREGRALCLAMGALVLQNLSCGYYMVYFAPFVAAWAVFESVRSGRTRDLRTWLLLGAGFAAALACTVPFMVPYFLLRDVAPATRPLSEVVFFSANLLGWLTAPESSLLWGRVLRVFPAPEGQLFPGLIALGLALLAMAWHLARSRRDEEGRGLRGLAGMLTACLLFAVLMSMGPSPAAGGTAVTGLGTPFLALYHTLPGFDGLRVAARFAMIGTLFVALLAGLGWLALPRRASRSTTLAAIVSVLVVIEGLAVPFPLNVEFGADPALATPPSNVPAATSPPAVYRQLANIGGPVVVTELPLGDTAWDLRAVFGSTMHWHRIVNGFSGYLPPSYRERASRLLVPTREPDAAWDALERAGTTHVVFNRRAYHAQDAAPVEAWLVSHGARQIGEFGHTALYEIPSR
jgi:hypothetical protein